jgi:2-phosphosulfolactate phosphatase
MVVRVDIELAAKDAYKAARRGDVIIVIDVLRASTSIITSLANGAKSVTPVATLEEAAKLRQEHPDYVLVGEREDRKPEGFDLGNSPAMLTRERLRGKNIILTTTNGTKALIKSKESGWVAVGAFVNAQAVAGRSVEISSRNGTGISLVLAGEKNRFSLEDFLCAGAITERFPKNAVELSDKTMAALSAFKGVKHNLLENIRNSKHGQDLAKIGFSKDIEFSCQLDIYGIVPFYRNGKVEAVP